MGVEQHDVIKELLNVVDTNLAIQKQLSGAGLTDTVQEIADAGDIRAQGGGKGGEIVLG